MPLSARLSVDIGGTFTDFVLLRSDGAIFTAKVSSTPAAPEEAVLAGMDQLLAAAEIAPGEITEVLHGTTVGSNTLLQKLGARTGLITTRGFRDVLEIGRLRTPTMFDLTWDKPQPLVARRHRLEVNERTRADGTVTTPLVADDVMRAGSFFAAEGIESVAICFLNSYRNPANERAALDLFRRAFPDIAATASIDVLPETGEYERTSTVAVNAYVLPSLSGYLSRLEDALRAAGVNAPLLVGNSNGGLSPASVARQKPVFFISSGRSSGAAGAARLGATLDAPDLVAFDMGGTTASASLVHRGVLSRTNEYEFRAGMSVPSRFIKAGGYMMRVPTVDVAEVGSGAGSIAAIDPAGLLTVGPISAGAAPGPVCYGQGGTWPTVTDANVVLGLLPDRLAGGTLALDIEAARGAIAAALGKPLGLSVAAAALGIREIANANMVRAIRAVTIERGLDPRDLALLAFGGSGPVHACDLAAMLGIRRIVFPPGPGVFTAMGMLAGSVEHHELRNLQADLETLDLCHAEALLRDMRAAARAALAAEGCDGDAIGFEETIDLRLQGQDAALSIPIAGGFDRDALREAFLSAYRDTYGYRPADAVESTALRLEARACAGEPFDFGAPEAPAGGSGRQAATRPVHFDRSGPVETPVLPRDAIGGPLRGPVIVESADTTIVIPPGAAVAPDAAGSLVATLEAGR
jgi:N-methylhydantoinase A